MGQEESSPIVQVRTKSEENPQEHIKDDFEQILPILKSFNSRAPLLDGGKADSARYKCQKYFGDINSKIMLKQEMIGDSMRSTASSLRHAQKSLNQRTTTLVNKLNEASRVYHELITSIRETEETLNQTIARADMIAKEMGLLEFKETTFIKNE